MMQTLNRLKSDRSRRKDDFYETPYGLCKAAIRRFSKDEGYIITLPTIDAGCGTGVWGKAVEDLSSWFTHVTGIDIENRIKLEYQGCYRRLWHNQDFLEYSIDLGAWNAVIGNPPYVLAEEFIRKGLELVCDGGYVYFLLRLAFLESKKRHFGLYTDHPPKRVYVLSRRPSFFSTNGKKTTDAISYAMFLFQKGFKGRPELDWLYWEYEDDN